MTSPARRRWLLIREVISYFVGIAGIAWEAKFDHFANPLALGVFMGIAGFNWYRNGRGHE